MKNNKFEEIIALYSKYGLSDVKNNCFLDIINKNYDECIISKLILYVFNNPDRLSNLIEDEVVETITDCGTEFTIDDSRRIDIYFEGVFDNSKKFFIVIENKINSNVHDCQCKKYYEWVVKNPKYSSHKKYFFFLKPFYNAAIPDDKEHYQIITYDKLYEIIGKTKDLYCNELKKEIKNNLMKQKYNELDKYMLNNLLDIKKKTDYLWKDINKYFYHLTNQFSNGAYEFDISYLNDCTYFRLYDKKENWLSIDNRKKDDMYYFYFEVYVSMDLKNIFIQQIVKTYSDNPDSKLNKFMINKYERKAGRLYYIVKYDKFTSTYADKLFSDEWKIEFENWFNLKFLEASENIRNYVRDFRNF